MTPALFQEPRLQAGVDEFNAGHHYEAHEVWEELWLELVGPEKELVQGLIQIAAGYLKLGLGNDGAARKLWGKGTLHVENAGGCTADPRLAAFIAAVRTDLAALPGDPPIRAPRLALD